MDATWAKSHPHAKSWSRIALFRETERTSDAKFWQRNVELGFGFGVWSCGCSCATR